MKLLISALFLNFGGTSSSELSFQTVVATTVIDLDVNQPQSIENYLKNFLITTQSKLQNEHGRFYFPVSHSITNL
jgi:hypothetical protein